MTASLFPRRPARAISVRERAVSLALLSLLAALLGLFLLARGLPGPAGLPVPEASAASGTPLPLTSPAGWPRGAIERYDAETLFEKINGKADAYFALGFEALEFASYSRPDDPSGSFVDAYLYDMGQPLHAFGIFRAQQGGKGKPLSAGDEGSAEGAFAFARKDRYYLEVVASGPSAAAEAEAIATAIADALPAEGDPVGDPPWFPKKGLVSVGYVLENCLMVESLTDAFLAKYSDGTQVVVARPGSPAEACKEAREVFEFLGTPARFAVVGDHVVGVVSSPAPEPLLQEVARRLEERE